ncbi:MAG: short-chain dehydrogenase [Acidimicrobiales bacterium]|jgi:short-subunit dehydrogenase|nr:short-chain dehydrogenase [Acidimicrobiales bacterium]
MDVRERVAVVTGASSGIGAAVAVELARRGATVVAVARRADRLEETTAACRRHTSDSFARPTDVGAPGACRELADEVAARLGRVDIVVNNAGISPGEDPRRRALADADAIMAVNFFGPVALVDATLPGMLERRSGSIVNVTSVSGYVPAPGEPAYGASKAALSRWSHGLAVDLHGSGVHVGVMSPGPIDTEIWGHGDNTYRGKLYPASVVATAIARMIERETVHATVPRQYGAVGAVYPLLGRPIRWGVRKYASHQER